MSSEIYRTTLAGLDAAGIADAYNATNQGYVIPFNVTPEWANLHVTITDIALEHSPIWLDEHGEIVAFAALAVRGERGWVGGFGVVPEWRGRGLSHQLIAETLERARIAGLRTVLLEVIQGNERAEAVYTRAGFRRVRQLLVLSRDAAEYAPMPEMPAGGVEADPATLLSQRERIVITRPPWPNEPAGMRRMENLSALALGSPAHADGYVLYRTGAAAGQLMDLAAPDDAVAEQLLNAVLARHPDLRFQLVNEPEESPTLPALERAGFTELLRQWEMVWEA